MLAIDKNNKITMINGDTAYIDLTLDNYALSEGDAVTITIKRKVTDTTPALTKTFREFNEDGSCTIIFLPEETYGLEATNYIYDIQVNMIDGRVDTVIGPATFSIVRGVTDKMAN